MVSFLPKQKTWLSPETSLTLSPSLPTVPSPQLPAPPRLLQGRSIEVTLRSGQKWGPDAIMLGHPGMHEPCLPVGLLREPSAEKSHQTRSSMFCCHELGTGPVHTPQSTQDPRLEHSWWCLCFPQHTWQGGHAGPRHLLGTRGVIYTHCPLQPCRQLLATQTLSWLMTFQTVTLPPPGRSESTCPAL